MILQLFNKAKYALLLVKYGGLEPLLSEVKWRVYHRVTYFGLEKNLSEPDAVVESRLPYSLKLATPEDIRELYSLVKTGDKGGMFERMKRIWFYNFGFHHCYVARSREDNNICYVQWTISARDNKAEIEQYKTSFSFSRLGNEDIQLEHAYTFEKYRGKNIMPAVMNDLFQIARERGFKRVVTYVESDNIASLKGCDKVGFKKFEEVHRQRFLSLSRYRIIRFGLPADQPQLSPLRI